MEPTKIQKITTHKRKMEAFRLNVPSDLIINDDMFDTPEVIDTSCSVSTLSNNTTTTANYDRSISIARTDNWRRKSIQALIDDEIQSYNDWRAELFLDVILDGDIIPTRVNVMDHIGAKGSLHRLRFCTKNIQRMECSKVVVVKI